MVVAEWDDSCVVFLLKGVKIETERHTQTLLGFLYYSIFGVVLGYKKTKCDKKLQMCLTFTSAGN